MKHFILALQTIHNLFKKLVYHTFRKNKVDTIYIDITQYRIYQYRYLRPDRKGDHT